MAVRVSLREVLDETSIEDLRTGDLPDRVRQLLTAPDAWQTARHRAGPAAAESLGTDGAGPCEALVTSDHVGVNVRGERQGNARGERQG